MDCGSLSRASLLHRQIYICRHPDQRDGGCSAGVLALTVLRASFVCLRHARHFALTSSCLAVAASLASRVVEDCSATARALRLGRRSVLAHPAPQAPSVGAGSLRSNRRARASLLSHAHMPRPCHDGEYMWILTPVFISNARSYRPYLLRGPAVTIGVAAIDDGG